MSLTDDLAAARTSADGLAALCEASGRVATGRLTARGLIEGVPDALATLVGVGSDQLRGMRLTSIVDIADRPTVNAAIDSVFEQSRRARIATTLRSEEHKSELQSLMRISYAVFCLKKQQRQ